MELHRHRAVTAVTEHKSALPEVLFMLLITISITTITIIITTIIITTIVITNIITTIFVTMTTRGALNARGAALLALLRGPQ